ncbi:MAG: Peptide deformylase [Devosia sp.]|uniref:peptide deformylase n=1 Tax=Devosia sp. TaxID=1871048 RepID=UPI0026104B6B|nr:peptide deformylase [Devosia sp.]MDB5586904.1 Peptide deformylase [Devosia sp.]
MAEFVRYPDPRLTAKAVPRSIDAALRGTAERLVAAASEVQAYGLAAAHIGEIEPLVVISVAAETAQRDYQVLFNPEIIAAAESSQAGPEGSVSMPGIEAPIERPVWVDVAYDTVDGERITTRFEGFVARCALHEIEQMNGIFFLSRLSRLKRDTAIRKFQKLGRTQ